ncbi:MAG TPA: hypothetical protein PLU49_09290, partial [Saprospiraceae bacterium]|nr:hypothetical protein [Saprospiraceae bacterium]
ANTISFLFQIFSFGLIALGGYLLIFYEKKFNTIKKNSEKIIMNTLSNQIIAYLLYSASLVYHINPKNSKTRSRYLPKLRTYIKEIDRVLTLKSEYVDDGLVEICLNLNEDILTQLKLFKTQGIHEDELIETVKNIELTLKAIKA